MKNTFHNQRDREVDAMIQDEVITAKSIQVRNPDLSWTECLRLAKDAVASRR